MVEVYSLLPLFAIICPFVGAVFLPGFYILSRRARYWLPTATVLTMSILILMMSPGILSGFEYVYFGLRVTAPGYFMGLVTSIVGLAVTTYSGQYMKGLTETKLNYYHMLMLSFIGGILGMFFSTNLAAIFLFLEISTILSIILVSFEGGRAFEAGYKFYMLSGLGGMFTIVSITLIYAATGTLDLSNMPGILSSSSHKHTMLLDVGAVLAIVGFGLKAGLVPFHAWLPDAHAEAPTPISAVLSGVVVKTGAYALFLILFTIYGWISSGKILVFLYSLAVASMLFGAFMALAQSDIKRLLAYSTVSQMGYILLGLAYGSTSGIEGGLLHILNHSTFKVILFLCAGNLILKTGARSIRKMGGLARRLPATTFSFIVASLSMAGVPPFNGFWSKILIYYAGVESNQIILTIVAVFTSCITLAYMVRASHMIFFGELPMEFAGLSERIDLSTLPPLALSILCTITGIYPEIGLQMIRPASQFLIGLILGRA
ncbi:hypothetical protein KEJ51_08210 [Candidatus Bathyarchaeota archaeon]|nr:hypothetical protein [Candidatus Bathyarchaeota archaeon]